MVKEIETIAIASAVLSMDALFISSISHPRRSEVTTGLQVRRAISIQAEGKRVTEKAVIAPLATVAAGLTGRAVEPDVSAQVS